MTAHSSPFPVVPAQAGTQGARPSAFPVVPAQAGTQSARPSAFPVVPAQAGTQVPSPPAQARHAKIESSLLDIPSPAAGLRA